MSEREAAAAGRRDRAKAPGPRPSGPRSRQLRQNVRLLTTMLGDAIAESGGAELLARVEALRTATIALRGRATESRRERVVALVAELDPASAEDVIRAFTCYFQLVNLAEERHRVRIYLARGDRPDLAAEIRDELARTTDLVLSVSGHARLLDSKPDLQRAIEYRNPYVDALSFLQVRFLGEPHDPATERLVQATISGVAAGLQNTG